MKNNKSRKNKNNLDNKSKNKQIPDLTSYLSPDDVQCDVDGSYTGIPADMYYNNELDELPVQDADDL